MKIEKITSKV